MKKMRTVALAWVAMATLGMAVGQTVAADGKADSSASQRNGKQKTADGKPAAAKRAMTFADLMAMRRVSDPQISPSGKWVMFSVTDVSLEKNTKVNHLWVVALAGAGTVAPTARPIDKAIATEADRKRAAENPEKQVTFGDGESFGRFSPDGKSVSFSLKDQIYLAPWDEAAGKVGTAVQVTNVAGGADGAIWSPDSKRLMFTAQVYPTCSVKAGARAVSAPTHRDTAAMDGAPEIMWAEEDACDKAKDEAAVASPVKGQVWDSLLYRHWDQYTGLKRTHILVVDVDGGGSSKGNDWVRDVTPASAVGDAETPTWMLGGPLEYAWAPDSKEIAYVTNLDKVPAASTNNDVFTLRLDEPGAKAVKVSTSPGSDDEPEYSPDGKWLAFRSQARAGFESDRFRLMVVQRVSELASQRVIGREWSEPKELMPKFDRWVDEFTWAPDSKSIFFASGDAGTTFVGKVNIGGTEPGKIESIWWDYHELSELALSRDGVSLVVSEMGIDMPTEISATDLRMWTSYTTLPMSADKQKEYDDRRSFSIDSTLPHTQPQPILSSHDREKITHLNDALLDQLDLAELGTFKFVGADGTPVQGFIVKPPNFDPTKKYPVKFVMHGGPQTALGDSWSYRWNWELLAADGYVVVGINRRGSTGYGQKFVDEVSGDWGGRAYVDLMKGLDYAEATYPFIDKTRECALGASYGGFMADWVLTHTNRFQCIVTHDGMVDPVSAYGTTEEMWFNEWEFRRPEDFPAGWDGFSGGYDPVAGMKADSSASLRNDKQKVLRNDERGGVGHPAKATTEILTGGQNDELVGQNDGRGGVGHPATPWRYAGLAADQDPFRKWSALRSIEKAKTPTLIIHSQRDYRLDVSQGFELFTALQRQGVPSRFLYFPDESHWVLKPQDSQLWYETVGDWCDRWTRTGKYAETK